MQLKPLVLALLATTLAQPVQAGIASSYELTRLGPTGTDYTNSSTGEQYSYVNSLNDAGQVAGHSTRYNGSTDNGQSAWLYNGTTTQNIGLTGTGYTGHTDSELYQYSTVSFLNAAGQAAGTSKSSSNDGMFTGGQSA
ncbi:MAG: hypothetical protein Q8Q28_16955 [Pseudomonadota bacterium]|nr:hypothetical protein [Pseudomonadota bacterium]